MKALFYDPSGSSLDKGSLSGLNDLLQYRLQTLLSQGWSLADSGPTPPDTLRNDCTDYTLAFFLRLQRGDDYTFLALYLPDWLGL